MKLSKSFGVAVVTLSLALGSTTPASATGETLGAEVHLNKTMSASANSKVVGKKAKLKLRAGYSGSANIPWKTVKYSVAVQEKVGAKGTWATIEGLPVKFGSTGFSVTVPGVSVSGKSKVVYYRFISEPNETVLNTSTSKALAVTYENQGKYTGFKKKVWNDVKKYCPTAAIRVKDLSGNRAGLYKGGHLLYIDSGIKKYSSANRKAVGLHECAHLRQTNDLGTFAHAKKVLKKHFKAPKNIPIVEHSADCASIGINPKGYLGYGGTCTIKERKAGKKLLLGTLA